MFPEAPLTRRQALLATAGIALSAVPAAALLKPTRVFPTNPPPPSTPPAAGQSILDTLIKRGRTRDRTLHIYLLVEGRPPQIPLNFDPATISFATTPSLVLQSAVLVFPVNKSTASSTTDIENVTSTLRFDAQEQNVTAVYNDGYPCGTRLAKWELRDKVGHQLTLDLDIPMTCWETIFDDAAAANVAWPGAVGGPKTWSAVAQSTFAPQLGIDRDDPVLVQAVNELCNNKPPDSIPPVQLAKYFCGKVAEAIQLSGEGAAPTYTGYYAGVQLKGAAQTWIDKQGSPHDMACLLAALYRNAGLPARVVVGYDITETKGQRATPFDRNKHGNAPTIRPWVEFCLYDVASNKELWVPADPARIRKFSSRMQDMSRPWKYFGSHDDLDDVLPFAFQYHPPTTVSVPGDYEFWGWSIVPALQNAVQGMRFSAITTPITPK